MIINVFDRDLNRLGVIDEIVRLEWRRRYWLTGDLVMILPLNEHHAQLIKKGNLIMLQGGNEAAEIRYISIHVDDNGAEEIEVRGPFLAKWAGKRLLAKRIVATDAPENLMLRIVRENVTEPTDERRRIPQISAATAESSGRTVEYSGDEYVNALDEIERIATEAEIGFRVRTDARNQTNTFEVYVGRDLTAGNEAGNEPCIFAREYDNIIEQSYEYDSEDVRNMAYVQGEETEDAAPTVVEVGADAEGLDRDEVYSSAADINRVYEDDAGNEVTLTEEEYAAMLRQRGLEDLALYPEVLNFDARIQETSGLKYREDYDLGDVVTCRDKKWGIQINTRITEIVETYKPGENKIEVVFGQPTLTLGQKLKRMERR